jgi:two-component system invasion response regulator UvrY
MLKVLVVDDHEIVREGLKMVFNRTPNVRVQGEACNGQEAIEKARTVPCDIVLLDVALPDKDGLDVLKAIHTEKPALPVLVYTMFPESRFALRALRAGASGYITKDRLSENLLEAIERVSTGRKYVSHELGEAMLWGLDHRDDHAPHEALSNREFQVLCLLGSGLRISDIAARWDISVKTVSTYRSRIFEKMGFANNAQLVRYAVEHALV